MFIYPFYIVLRISRIVLQISLPFDKIFYLNICWYLFFISIIINQEVTMANKKSLHKLKIGYTTGVFDMFHVGHLNILKRAKELCDFLIVGVSTDELVIKEKNKTPIIPFEDRAKIVAAIKYVDKVVPQVDKNKFGAWEQYHFNIMFVGSDWKGTPQWLKFEEQLNPFGVKIVYLPHTDGISSTLLRSQLIKNKLDK